MRTKSINFLAKTLLLIAVASTSVMATTFVDINKMHGHKFPEEVRELGIPVTLLHNHKHTHGCLVYSRDYKKSFYRDNVSSYHACSWYLNKDGKAIPYEYCEEKIDYDMENIEENLRAIEATGHEIYGTTVRPVKGLVELETADGHVYMKEEEMKKATVTYSAKTQDGIFSKEGKKPMSEVFTGAAETVIAPGPITLTCTFVDWCFPNRFVGHIDYRAHVRTGMVVTEKAIMLIDDLLAILSGGDS